MDIATNSKILKEMKRKRTFYKDIKLNRDPRYETAVFFSGASMLQFLLYNKLAEQTVAFNFHKFHNAISKARPAICATLGTIAAAGKKY